MFFITTKFHGILLSGFRGVALTKKNRTDGLTDGTKTLYPSATRCVGYNNDNSNNNNKKENKHKIKTNLVFVISV